MNGRDRDHLQELLDLAALGTLTRSDGFALAMLVRQGTERGSALRDFADCVAHRVRDRKDAPSFGYVSGWAANITKATRVDPTTITPLLFDVDELLNDIEAVARTESVTVDRRAIRLRQIELVSVLGSVLEGVEIQLDEPGAVCRFTSGPAGLQPSFALVFNRTITSNILTRYPIGFEHTFPILMHVYKIHAGLATWPPSG